MLGVTRCPCWVRVMFSICWLRAWSRACEVTFLEGFVLVVLMSFFFSFLLRICPRVSSFICVNFFCLLSASSSLQLFLFCLSSAFAASAPCETATKFYLWLSLFFFFFAVIVALWEDDDWMRGFTACGKLCTVASTIVAQVISPFFIFLHQVLRSPKAAIDLATVGVLFFVLLMWFTLSHYLISTSSVIVLTAHPIFWYQTAALVGDTARRQKRW